MSDLQTFATLRGSAKKLKEMVRLASAGYHDDVYMRVVGDENRVYFNTQTNARQVMSFCTFADLDHVEGDAEAIIPVGLDNDTKGYLDYLSIAEGSGKLEMRLLGEESEGEHPHLASYWEAEGALSTRVRLPASEDDLAKVPWGLPERWTENDEYISAAAFDEEMTLQVDEDEVDDYTPPTYIQTTADTIRKSVIQPSEFVDDVDFYPVVVEDGDFRIHVEGNRGDDSIEGSVNAESVEGPDVDRVFDEGFDDLFGELSGPVTLATAPYEEDTEGPAPPLIVTQTDRSGRTIRHVLGPMVEG